MKKFLLSFILLFISACTGISYTSTNYSVDKAELYENVNCPQCIIDSLIRVDSLCIADNNFETWPNFSVFTSDSIVLKTYFIYDDECKSVISVFPSNEENSFNIKYTRSE